VTPITLLDPFGHYIPAFGAVEMQPLLAAALAVAAGFASARLAPCRPAPTPRSPPSWVFSVVWTTLYALQGAAATRSPTMLALLVLELAWPFLYCANELASRIALAPLAVLSLAALSARDPLVTAASVASATWLTVAMTL